MNLKHELKKLVNMIGVQFGKTFTDSDIKISERVVGGKVEVINADGSLAPAEDGDYEMADGFSFTIKDGQISSIVGEEAPAESESMKEEEVPTSGTTKEEVKAEDVPAEQAPQEDTSVADLTARVDLLEKKIDEMISAMEAKSSSGQEELSKATEAFATQVKQLNESIQTLAKVPVQFSKTNKSQLVEESREEKLMNVAKMLGQLK